MIDKTDQIYDLLVKIQERPQLYLRSKSVALLKAFVSGYVVGFNTLQGCRFRSDFSSGLADFIDEYYDNKLSIDWSMLIEKHCSSQEEGFDKFFELMNAYIADQNAKMPDTEQETAGSVYSSHDD